MSNNTITTIRPGIGLPRETLESTIKQLESEGKTPSEIILAVIDANNRAATSSVDMAFQQVHNNFLDLDNKIKK